jgi:hypothetical protein
VPVTWLTNAFFLSRYLVLSRRNGRFDKEVNEVFFNADLYRRQKVTSCLVEGGCGETEGDWRLVKRPHQGSGEADKAATASVRQAGAGKPPREISGPGRRSTTQSLSTAII